MAVPKAFDRAEFAATLTRMARGADHSQANMRPAFDATLNRDVVDAFLKGRKIEDYRQALEAQGFSYHPPERLAAWTNGERKTEGEWRNPQMRMAFTDKDLLSSFATSEAFWTWCERQRNARRAARAGLVLPRARR